MDVVGHVVQVEEGLAVRPAFDDDAARLRVERKQRSVDVARGLHHSAEPPPHVTRVVHVHAVHRRVAVRIEAARTALDTTDTFSPLGKVAGGLYILPMFFRYFFYFFLFFFNGRLSSPRSSDTNGAIFTKISVLVERCKGLLTSLSFF